MNRDYSPSSPAPKSECGVQLRNGELCGSAPRPGMPFPICTRHALQVWMSVKDEAARLMTERGYVHEQTPDEVKAAAAIEIEAKRIRQAQAVVYYVAMPGGTIKIGTTINLAQRLVALRVDRSAVLATEPGSVQLERVRHKQFADLRIGRREDFTADPRLIKWVQQIHRKNGDPVITGYVGASEVRQARAS